MPEFDFFLTHTLLTGPSVQGVKNTGPSKVFGWTSTTDAGTFWPLPTQGIATHGTVVAVTQAVGAQLSQTTSATVAGDTTYILRFDAIRRLNVATFPGYRVALVVNGVERAVVDRGTNFIATAGGTFAETIGFSTLPSDADIGSAISIVITGKGAETNFDFFRLATTPRCE